MNRTLAYPVLDYHGMQFTTKDKDQDSLEGNCAKKTNTLFNGDLISF